MSEWDESELAKKEMDAYLEQEARKKLMTKWGVKNYLAALIGELSEIAGESYSVKDDDEIEWEK